MNKKQMLDAVEHAKKIHLEEMHKINSVLKGNEIEDPTPLGKMECKCGIWFYSNEKEMREILGAQLFERLDKLHEKWHQEYHHIYNIFFKEEKKTGFFSKILKQNKIDSLTLDKGKLYFVELQKITNELLSVSESAIRRISALKESKFN